MEKGREAQLEGSKVDPRAAVSDRSVSCLFPDSPGSTSIHVTFFTSTELGPQFTVGWRLLVTLCLEVRVRVSVSVSEGGLGVGVG